MVMIGEIHAFAGNFVPLGWILCDGRLMSVSSYQALYSLIGNTYGGVKDVSFNVPDLRGRSMLGYGVAGGINYTLGQRVGNESIQLNTQQMPPHNHYITNDKVPVSGNINVSINVNGSSSDTANPNGAYIGKFDDGDIYSSVNGSTLNASALTINHDLKVNASTLKVSDTGNGASIPIVQPVLATNWIINYDGIYPQRA